MKNKLIYDTPCTEWVEGMPLGNGKIGAMIWGDYGNETITLNHKSLVRANIQKKIKTSHLIPKIRELIMSGKSQEAQDIFNLACKKYPPNPNSYQVFCELKFDFNHRVNQKYSRMLDMQKALVEIGNIDYKITAFTDFVHNIFVVKIASNQNRNLDFKVKVDRSEDKECYIHKRFVGNEFHFNASFIEGVEFSSVIRVKTTDGTVEWIDDRIVFEGCSMVEIRQSFCTGISCDHVEIECGKILASCEHLVFDDLLQSHTKSYESFYNRADIKLTIDKDEIAFEDEYLNLIHGKNVENSIYEYLFNSARYYTISASAPESDLPMNLQGIWNNSIDPMWQCGYTTDMNIQMHYWLTFAGNLSECHKPVFKWLFKNEQIMRDQAKNIFGCRGYYIPQYTDDKMTPACWQDLDAAAFQILWNGAAGWLAQHFYEYWKYTGDDSFLMEYTYPFLRECANFFIDYLCIGEDGKYMSCPSLSPENRTKDGNWLVNTSTIDLSIIRELFSNLIKINTQYNLNDENYSHWVKILENLIDYPINHDGAMLEWVEDVAVLDPYHRHISHIYGLFPSKLFVNLEDENLYNATIKALHKRREGGFGSAASWSHAWYACCFARIGDGDASLCCIDDLLHSGVMSNLLTVHNDWREQGLSNKMIDYKLLQIDALLGAASAVCEMFVQSYDKYILIAPAIPKKWSSGKVNGLMAYGNFEVSIEWKEHVLTDLNIISHKGGTLKLKILCRASATIEIETKKDQLIKII